MKNTTAIGITFIFFIISSFLFAGEDKNMDKLISDLQSDNLTDKIYAAKHILNNPADFQELYVRQSIKIAGEFVIKESKQGLIKILGGVYPRCSPLTQAQAALSLGDISTGLINEKEGGVEDRNDIVKALSSALTNPHFTIRVSAAMALGNTKNEKAIDPLEKALSDENPLVQLQAARSLIQITGNDILTHSPQVNLTQKIKESWNQCIALGISISTGRK